MSDIFDSFNQLSAETSNAGQQLAFEEKVVKSLFRFAKYPLSFPQIKARTKRDWGSDTLGLKWFANYVPTFPFNLATAKLKYTANPRWTNLFGAGFMKQPWAKEYQAVVSEMGWDVTNDHCALIFNVPHADKSTLMVMHNQPNQSITGEDAELREHPELRLIFPFGRPRVTYVIESFNSFMLTVGTHWADNLEF